MICHPSRIMAAARVAPRFPVVSEVRLRIPEVERNSLRSPPTRRLDRLYIPLELAASREQMVIGEYVVAELCRNVLHETGGGARKMPRLRQR